MAGLMETIEGEPYNGRADLPALASAFQMEADELLPIGEALQMLGFAEFEEGDIKLTDAGRRFVGGGYRRPQGGIRRGAAGQCADDQCRSARCWTSAGTIGRRRCASATNWRITCRRTMPTMTMRTIIAWGRYAELFSYDREADQFALEDDRDGERLQAAGPRVPSSGGSAHARLDVASRLGSTGCASRVACLVISLI